MPTVPMSSPSPLASAAGAGMAPTSPTNFLLAAADLHSQGEFQSAPVPEGHNLQTGKNPRKRHMQVVK